MSSILIKLFLIYFIPYKIERRAAFLYCDPTESRLLGELEINFELVDE
jgi:hypothetical protein